MKHYEEYFNYHAFLEGFMARLWRSVFVLALCLTAVIGLRIYLSRQIEVAQSDVDSPVAGAVAK